MIRKKAARKADAFVSRETIDDDSEDSDDSDAGTRRRQLSSSLGDDRRSSTLSEADSEPRMSAEPASENYPVNKSFFTAFKNNISVAYAFISHRNRINIAY
jgi:hypothetical protein